VTDTERLDALEARVEALERLVVAMATGGAQEDEAVGQLESQHRAFEAARKARKGGVA
jgi:hypothetical protein